MGGSKSWLKQNGECFDSRGVPIYRGDLLRTPHFRGRRRKMYYLYHVVVFDVKAGGLRMVPASHLDPELRDGLDTRGGNPLLSDSLACDATVIYGRSIGDDLLFDERPRRRPPETTD